MLTLPSLDSGLQIMMPRHESSANMLEAPTPSLRKVQHALYFFFWVDTMIHVSRTWTCEYCSFYSVSRARLLTSPDSRQMSCVSVYVPHYLWKVQQMVNFETQVWNATFKQCPTKLWFHPRCGNTTFFCSEKNGLVGESSIVREIIGFFPPRVGNSLPRVKAESHHWVLNAALGLQFCCGVSSEWPRACGVSAPNASSARLCWIVLL